MVLKFKNFFNKEPFRYPWDPVGDWTFVAHYDFDHDHDPPYLDEWEHKDGRRAFAGPGVCDDPELSWYLFDYERKSKKNADIRNKLQKIWLISNIGLLSLLLLLGVLTFASNGAWFLFSLIGYGSVSLGSYSIAYVGRGLKNSLRLLTVDILLIVLGLFLINFGKFKTIALFDFEILIFWIGCLMGITKGIIDDY
tara:strand:- start:432 stop:1016 length:585 start_codon:yes stop_codon:yes gene_type:complete